MISRNMNSGGAKPFLLQPVGKEFLWGGRRLKDDFGKETDSDLLAESWECSTHPEGTNIVDSGIYKGERLDKVLQRHPEYLGTSVENTSGLPIMIKLIDAKQDLSIQVHPDDEYAQKNENGSLGKTEMWYVLDAAKDARLIYGFYHDMDEETVRKSLESGTIEKYLQKVHIEKDDVFFIHAGVVHAIGAGALIAEIQENSNLTYRLYDYDREDKNGKKRELHIKKALDVVNLSASTKPRQPMRVLRYRRGCASELLCRCQYFQVERQLVNTECYKAMVSYRTSRNSFQVLLCVEGCGVLFEENGESINFFKGDCIFVPANSVPLKIHGKAQLLRVSC